MRLSKNYYQLFIHFHTKCKTHITHWSIGATTIEKTETPQNANKGTKHTSAVSHCLQIQFLPQLGKLSRYCSLRLLQVLESIPRDDFLVLRVGYPPGFVA